MRILAVFSVIGLLAQIGIAQAADNTMCNPQPCPSGGAAAVCPEKPCCPTGAASSIPAVPLDKYLRDNCFKPDNIEQVVPVPSAKSVQTGGAASISAVRLKDYQKDNCFNADKIKQYVPVPTAQTCPTGGAAPTKPIIMQPIITPSPKIDIQMPKGTTGGAAPTNKTIKGMW